MALSNSQLIRHLLFDLKINKLLEGKSKTIKTMHAKSCKQRKGEKLWQQIGHYHRH